jgi:hypothetical protein
MLDCVRMADQICRSVNQSPEARLARWKQETPIVTRFGSSIEAIVASLGDFDKIIGEALVFVQVESNS